MNEKLTRISIIAMLIVGALFISLGILVSLFISVETDRALQDIWLKPEGYEYWGEVPGKGELTLVRCIKIFNYSNPESIFQGELPKVAEVPCVSFQEFSFYKDWYYTDPDGNNFGQHRPSDYLAYHYNQTFEIYDQSSPQMDLNANITNFNTPVYSFFYGLCNSPPPFYAIPNLHDIILAFENDMYDTVISYAIFQVFFSNTTFLDQYLENQGFSESDRASIIHDKEYGWGSWSTLKGWVLAVLEWMESGSLFDGALEGLNNYFQIENLDSLVQKDSLLFELVEAALLDMDTRYGSHDRFELACQQWAASEVTLDLPFDLGSVPISAGLPFATYLHFNLTFNHYPEIIYILALLNDAQDFKVLAHQFLDHPDGYPKPEMSLMNLNFMGDIFYYYSINQFEVLEQKYGLNKKQTVGLVSYLYTIVQLEQVWKKKVYPVDGYSTMLSRWTHYKLVHDTIQLRNDLVWGLPAMMALCNWQQNDVTCKAVLSTANATEVCAGPFGWDIHDFKTWTQLATWVEASQKDRNSAAYKKLLPHVGSELDRILYQGANSLKTTIKDYLSIVSITYKCSKNPCTYEEMLLKQWADSEISLNLPISVQICRVQTSLTFSTYSDHFTTPIEWRMHSNLPMSYEQAASFISYKKFLIPTNLREFYQLYFAKDYEELMFLYGFKSIDYIKDFYKFFYALIPGLEFFKTLTLHDWVYGYVDPFFDFLGNTLDIENGGYPLVGTMAYRALLVGTNDTESTPYSVLYTGLSDPKKISAYYKYYGAINITSWGLGYNASSPDGTSYQVGNIWPQDITYAGGEGGVFGIYVDKDDVLPVFITALRINGVLIYDSEINYKGISALKFKIDPQKLLTSEYVPDNAKFNQLPNGFNGFLNITSQSAAPTFVGLPRCLLCEPDANKMVEYYAYNQTSPFSARILPSLETENSYSTVEPVTGVGVQSMLNLQVYSGIYPDYFFENITEVVPGKGLYLPFYALQRSQNYSQSQIDTTFSALKQATTIQKYVFFTGIILGSFFVLISLLLTATWYRKQRFGGWKSRPASQSFRSSLLMGAELE